MRMVRAMRRARRRLGKTAIGKVHKSRSKAREIPLRGKAPEREAPRSDVPGKTASAGTSTERERVVEAQVHRSAGNKSSGSAKPSSSAPKGQSANPPSVKPLSSVKPSSSAPLSPAVPVSPLPDIPQAVNGAKLVFVFDDAGQSLSQLENSFRSRFLSPCPFCPSSYIRKPAPIKCARRATK